MKRLFKLQRFIILALLVTFLCGILLSIGFTTNSDILDGFINKFQLQKASKAKGTGIEKQSGSMLLNLVRKNITKQYTNDNGHFAEKLDKESNNVFELKLPPHLSETLTDGQMIKPNYKVHVFYYPWYGSPEFDGEYIHWNHAYLQHWNVNEAKKWPSGTHVPPDDIGSNFYPELGPYSSRDPHVLNQHMQQIRAAGIGVLAVSWYPPGEHDTQRLEGDWNGWDSLLPQLMDAAHKYELKVCFHIEPYRNRSHATLRKHIQYILTTHGSHPAFYWHQHKERDLPLFYIYDSYLVKSEDWAQLFRPDAAMTVRGTNLDGLYIGLVVEERHRIDLMSAGFDGYYTYFASDGFTYGSSTRHWTELAQYAKTNDALFIPSVGPGYVDTRVRPWNKRNTKDREHGGYYEQSFKAALKAKPSIITITSFNEWHEGTQIEKATPRHMKGFRYLDYSPQSSDYYLALTRKWVMNFGKEENSQRMPEEI